VSAREEGQRLVGARFGDLWPRVSSGVCLIAVALFVLMRGGDLFVLFWLLVAAAVAWEWQHMVGGAHERARVLGLFVALIAGAWLARVEQYGLAVVVMFAMAGVAAALAGKTRRVWAASGALYAGLLLLCTCGLRLSFPFGFPAIGWLFAIVWMTDICAYFAGRTIGGPKLWLWVSPSKTWSGTLVGILCGALFGTFFLALVIARTSLSWPAPWVVLFGLGLALAAVSQGGDLIESAVKRRFAVKDSSRLIPGHGGVMDRVDGFVAAVAVATLLGGLRGFPTAAEGLFHWM
jgi:phosphatidate cytidylyltransferase